MDETTALLLGVAARLRTETLDGTFAGAHPFEIQVERRRSPRSCTTEHGLRLSEPFAKREDTVWLLVRRRRWLRGRWESVASVDDVEARAARVLNEWAFGWKLVERGVITGEQIDPLPGRGWISWPLLLLVHLPLAALNWLTRGRLQHAQMAVFRFEARVVHGLRLPRARSSEG